MVGKLTVKTLMAIEELKHLSRDDEGGVIVEYGLLVGLLVLTLAGFLATFGNAIGNWLGTVSDAVSGWGPVTAS